jgi:hypothetical protein
MRPRGRSPLRRRPRTQDLALIVCAHASPCFARQTLLGPEPRRQAEWARTTRFPDWHVQGEDLLPTSLVDQESVSGGRLRPAPPAGLEPATHGLEGPLSTPRHGSAGRLGPPAPTRDEPFPRTESPTADRSRRARRQRSSHAPPTWSRDSSCPKAATRAAHQLCPSRLPRAGRGSLSMSRRWRPARPPPPPAPGAPMRPSVASGRDRQHAPETWSACHLLSRDEAGHRGLGDDPVGDADARVGGLQHRRLM